MHTITRTTLLHARPHVVMRYIGHIAHHTEFMMPIISLTDITGDITVVGSTWKWSFVMAGVTISGTGETTRYIPDRFLEYETKGDAQTTISYATDPIDDNTRFTVTVMYETPASVMARVKEPLIHKLNGRVADQVIHHFEAIYN